MHRASWPPLIFSCLLDCGAFHCMIPSPMSIINTSPLLKLFQLSGTSRAITFFLPENLGQQMISWGLQTSDKQPWRPDSVNIFLIYPLHGAIFEFQNNCLFQREQIQMQRHLLLSKCRRENKIETFSIRNLLSHGTEWVNPWDDRRVELLELQLILAHPPKTSKRGVFLLTFGKSFATRIKI